MSSENYLLLSFLILKLFELLNRIITIIIRNSEGTGEYLFSDTAFSPVEQESDMSEKCMRSRHAIPETNELIRRYFIKEEILKKSLLNAMTCISTHIPPKESKKEITGKRYGFIVGKLMILLISSEDITIFSAIFVFMLKHELNNMEIACITPVYLSILQNPLNATIIMHICIIAPDADRMEDITVFVLREKIILELQFNFSFDVKADISADIIFPDKMERKIITQVLVSGYKTAVTVPEINAGPLEKQKQLILLA